MDVIVIGAGAAGIAAANELTRRGLSATIVEARERAGGRVCSIEGGKAPFAIDVGAEFIHGRRNPAWRLAEAAGLPAHQAPDRHWRVGRTGLIETRSFWTELSTVLDRIAPDEPDTDLMSWLQRQTGIDQRLRHRTCQFVEGFHAAPADRIGIHAVARSHQASRESGGDASFRLNSGYAALIQWLLAQVLSRNASLLLSTVVQSIRWRRGDVEVEADTPAGPRILRAPRAVITLPLGVLKRGSVHFEPELEAKAGVIESLGIAHAAKVQLLFRSRCWPIDNFGFIHSDEEWLPTWWSDERGLLLTGWCGGPRAEALAAENDAAIRREAVRALGRIFSVPPQTLERELIEFWRHNWSNDPLTLGAYSYAPAGCGDASTRLGEPIDDTLFFAGEATDTTGNQGTVHAALASGRRVAAEIMKAGQEAGCLNCG